MRRLSSYLLLSCLVFCCFVNAQKNQPTGSAAAGDQPIFTTDTRLVDLPVSVSDKSGKLIMDLPQKAFKVYENGVEQPIKIFKREDVPVSIGIIIDNSGSMKERRHKVEVATMDLLKESNHDDEVFIV